MVILMILGMDAMIFTLFIRTLQLIILLRILKLNYPANVSFFMRMTISIATFDYLEKFDLFSNIADPNYNPLDAFENDYVIQAIGDLGMSGHNSLVNLNTVAFVIFITWIRLILVWIL